MKLKDTQVTASEVGSDDDVKQWPFEVLKRFRLIFKTVQQHSQWVESHCGVSSAQLWVLWELSRTPGLKVTDLAKAMSIHHSTACNLLDKLAKKGLILRERISQDQRVVTVTLTQAGIDIIALAPSSPQGILQHALFDLPESLLMSLALQLDELIKAMEVKDEDAALQPLNPIPTRTSRKKRTPLRSAKNE
jgi:DNA-binding MarR family transcriptional regulator